MFLAVLWAATAAVLGFMIGRVSMYSMYGWKEELAEGSDEMNLGMAAAGQLPESGVARLGKMFMRSQTTEKQEAGNGMRVWEGLGAAPLKTNARKRSEGLKSGTDKRIWPAVKTWPSDRSGTAYRHWDSGRIHMRRRGGRKNEEEAKTWSLGSPVAGELMLREDEERPRIVIYPEGDRLYAPADGKITRLFPMGNAFLFTTEFGLELYIQAGEANDELLGRCYRPRVIQNEVVPKGRLLLEFDRQGLESEGVSLEVSICVESCLYGSDVRAAVAEWVDAGDEILQVSAAPEKYPTRREVFRV